MPNAALMQIERRLTELACPQTELQRKTRELAEHHEDLKRDALEEGLSEADAEARADELLGEPVALAEHLAAALRQSSWWGRHPFIGFCLLPPLAIMPLFVFGLWLEYQAGRLFFSEAELGSLSDWQTGLNYCRVAMLSTYYAAIVSTAVLFCMLARRTVAGFKWASAVCAMCALHGAFFYTALTPHSFTVGYANEPQWLAAFLPLAIALVIWFKMRRAAGRVGLSQAQGGFSRTEAAAGPQFPKGGFLTPTSFITLLMLAAIVLMIFHARAASYHRPAPASPVKTIPARPAVPGKLIGPVAV